MNLSSTGEYAIPLSVLCGHSGSANGSAHLPPILARRHSAKITFSAKWPPHPRAEGGQPAGVSPPIIISDPLEFQIGTF
jgi:hypothetical protein